MAVALAALAVLGMAAFAVLRPLQVLPRAGVAPAFTLQDAGGRPVTHETVAGKMVLYSFLAGGGADGPGQQVLKQLARLQAAVAASEELAEQVALVTVALDGHARAFAEKVGSAGGPAAGRGQDAGAPPWWFVSGPPMAVRLMAGTGFGVFYQLEGDSVAYEPQVVLVDAQGQIRATYRAQDLRPELLLRDLKLTAQEAQASGALQLAYEAAHLFVCYPQ